MNISFIHPISSFTNLLLVISDYQIIGSIEIYDDKIITNIDINPDYIDKVKKILLDKLLFELGIDVIEVMTENNNAEKYYKDFGFKKTYINKDGCVFLKYSVK